MALDKNNNDRQSRRIAAAALLAVAFAAILVHGRATRAVQLQPAKVVAVIEAVERPLRG